MQEAYAGLGMAMDDFPLARQMADEVLSLPIGPQLSSIDGAKVAQELSK